MFTVLNLPHTTNTADVVTANFITEEARGYLHDRPTIQFHHIRFDPQHYRDALFAQWGIAFPDHLTSAVVKRKAEYLAGRYCARRQLEVLGINAFDLHQGDDRAPIWPAGVMGSISHHQRSAIVVTSQADAFLGVDTELIMDADVAANLRNMIIDEQEYALLVACGLPFNQALTLVFSLKESLYKALYPQVKTFFDFHAARITALSPQQGRGQLQLTQSLDGRHVAGRSYQSQFLFSAQEVTTLIAGDIEANHFSPQDGEKWRLSTGSNHHPG